MRIAVIGGYAPSLVTFRAPLLRGMVERGHEVMAMAADSTPEVTRALADIGVAFVPLAISRAGLDPRADASTLAQLVRQFRQHRSELVFAYTIKPVIYAGLAGRLAGVPRRVAMITGLGYALTTPRSRRQQVVAAIARRMVRTSLGGCELLFVQNPDDRADLTRLAIVPPRLPIEIVRGSGVDIARYAVAPLPVGPPVFLFIGRILRDKGICEFVAAARTVRRRYPAARFQILGWVDPNPESVSRVELDRWVADGTVEYLGSTTDVRPYLQASHVLVLPSYREGTPRSVLEAMSMGRAVITTDAPGCRETVVDGVSGLVVPVADAEAVARAMLRLCESPDLVGRLGGAARQRVVELYDANHVAAGMLVRMKL